VLTDFNCTPFHPWKLIYQDPEGSSTPGKLVLPWRKVNVLAICTESDHQYRRSDPTAVVHSADWLDMNTFPHAEDALSRTRRFINTWKTGFAMKASQCSGDLYWIKPWIETFWSNYSGTQYRLTGHGHFPTCGICSIKDQKVHQHLENRFRHEWKSMFWPFIVNRTMNRHFLIQLQWYTVLTDWTWIFFHLRKMLYQGPEGSSTPGRRKVNVLAIYSESYHEYRRSDLTAVVHNTDRLDLNTFPPVEDALPSTIRLFNAWKKWFHREGNSMFWPC